MKKAERSKVINLSFHLKNLVKEKQEETLLPRLSCFSRVWLCATPETAAHQAPPSLGFSRQEHWSGLPFPSPVHESEKRKWSHQSCLTLRDPMDRSPPGSSVHWIFQARVLEWLPLPSPCPLVTDSNCLAMTSASVVTSPLWHSLLSLTKTLVIQDS